MTKLKTSFSDTPLSLVVGIKIDANGDMIGLNSLLILTIPTIIILKNTP